MSTNRVTKSSQRQADYSNIGYAGRKTGVVLKQSGARDQYGMPILDDLFSSPERPASPLRATLQSNGTLRSTGTESLVTITKSPPGTTQYSSPRKSIPPRARSPIKTSIGSPRKSINGSPTKTMGFLASPVRMGNRGESRAAGVEDTAVDTFASNKHKRRSLEQAPKRPPAPMSVSKIQLQAPRRSLFEVPSSPAVRQTKASHANGRKSLDQSPAVAQRLSPRLAEITESGTSLAVDRNPTPRINGRRVEESSEGELFVSQDHTSPLSPHRQLDLPVIAPEQPILRKPSRNAKGKRRLDDIEEEEKLRAVRKPPPPVVQLQEAYDEFEGMNGGFDDYEPDYNIQGETLQEEAEEIADVEAPSIASAPRSAKKPSSVTKAGQKTAQVRSPIQPLKRTSPFEEDLRGKSPTPAQKPRLSPAQTMQPPPKPLTKTVPNQAPARPPRERDANIAIMFGKTKAKQSITSNQTLPPPQPPLGKSRPKGRGLQIVRGDIEPEIDGARYTRSGRTSVKPVEYWRGERIIYTEPKREGKRVSLPGIKEVIRVEDEPERVRSKSKRKPAKLRKQLESVESEEDEPEQEWELDPGVFAGELPAWDPVEQRGDPEIPEQVDLAIAPRGLELLTRQAEGTTFQYAKTLTLPFFHSGMVDLPPGGEKRTKNSRRNHIVFWVFSGRVVVDVSGNEFSLGRGGMWQVPRGNTYSVNNPYDKPARIFFAQGCYMTEEEGEAYEEAEAAGAAQE